MSRPLLISALIAVALCAADDGGRAGLSHPPDQGDHHDQRRRH